MVNGYCRRSDLVVCVTLLVCCTLFVQVTASNCTASCVHGTCNNADQCICHSNWYGVNCSVFVCDQRNPCRNGATCIRHGNGSDFMCLCDEGYSGILCDGNDGRIPYTQICNSSNLNTCGDRGICVVDPYSHNETCICDSGSSGPTCETINNLCHVYSCYNGGTCVLTDTYFNCICPEGYASNTLCQFLITQYDRCAQLPCKNGATCITPTPAELDLVNGPYYHCACPPGYTGQNCTQNFSYCDINPCLNDGICTEYSNMTGYTCTCPPYFTGTDCHIRSDPCDTIQCINGGDCMSNVTVINNGEYEYNTTCNCTDGFTGGHCEVDINECTSLSNTCGNNSTCINLYGSYTCVCPVGYTGDQCDVNINDCNHDSCVNNGLCIDGVNTYTCDCIGTGYTGPRCDILINETCEIQECHFGGTCNYRSSLGRKTCTCPHGFIGELCLYKYQPCLSYCNRTGTSYCDLVGGCVCKDGYSGDRCDSVTNICDSSPCPNGSTCTVTNSNNYTCTCPPGVIDSRCLSNIISSCDMCSHNSTCIHTNNVIYCNCTDGWGGVDCTRDIDECFQSPCTNNGTCTNMGGSYVCTCPPHYIGRHCERYNGSCDLVSCANGGTCNSITDTCTCPIGYTGVYCEIELCPHSNCSYLANNDQCDLHCFTAACGYDGYSECTNYTNTFTNPWSNCEESLNCSVKYNNGICDQECNNGPCLYDGNDCTVHIPGCPIENITRCTPYVMDGICDESCNTLSCHIDTADCSRQVYLPGTLIMILFSSTRVQFSNEIDKFSVSLSRLINAEVEVRDYETISRDELSQYNYTVIVNPSENIIYWKVTLVVNIQYCTSSCPTSMGQVIKTIQASAVSRGQIRLADFGVVGAVEGPPPPDDEGGSSDGSTTQIIAVSASVCVGVILIVIAVGVLGKRVRDNGGITQTVKKVRVRGTWFIGRGGGASEIDSAPNTRDPSISDQRSSSRECIVESRRKDHTPWSPLKEGGVVIGERARDCRKWTPLHCEACRSSGEHALREILTQGGNAMIDVKGPGGFTPLMVAIVTDERNSSSTGHRKSVPVVRSDSSSSSEQSESNILITQSYNGGPPMLYSTGGLYGQQYTPVTAFISQQANVNLCNDYGQTPLHLAAKHGREDYIHILLSAKADPNIQDNWGQSPIHVSIGAATDRAFKALIDYPKSSIELKSIGGITPLMMCVKMASVSMLQQLLARNVDVSSTDNEGRTAVHWAAMINSLDSLKLLLKHGPDNIKDAPNARGETALYLACREGAVECVQYLLFECYANTTLMDMLDKSPLQIAYERQHGDIIELLKRANNPTGGPPLFTHKVSSANPLFGRVGSIKLEPGLAPPTYQQSVSSLPVGMSLPYGMSGTYPPPNGILATSDVPMATSSGRGLPRVSSIEAELELLVSSAALQFTYPTYSTANTSLLQGQPPLREDHSPGHSTEGVSPSGHTPSLHPEFSPGSSTHSPSVYPSTTPPAVHINSTHDGSHPLTHLPLNTSSYLSPPSSAPPPQDSYNTALQNISHTHLSGGHSPPLAHVTNSDSSLPMASGYSPHSNTHSPSIGYHGFPSPPKEAGEYAPPFITNQAPPTNLDSAADIIINSLTPSPEDYSNNSTTSDNSPPQLEHHATVLHYAYNYSTLPGGGVPSQFDFPSTHIAPIHSGIHQFRHHESAV